MRTRIVGVIAAMLLLAAACGDSGDTDTTPGTQGQVTATDQATTTPTVSDATPSNPLIQPGFLGPARAGLTETELRAQLGDEFELVPAAAVIENTEGFTALKGGVVQFHALHLVGEGPELDLLVTDNPAYRTAEAVGPGTTLDEATTIYGTITLSLGATGQARELIEFSGGPDPSIVFTAVGPSIGETAGIYPDPVEAFAETTVYQPGSTVGQVWVFVVEEETGLQTFDVPVGLFAITVSEGSSLNIRSGPGTEFPAVDRFPSGTDDVSTTGVGALSVDGDEWWQVELPNSDGLGWVSSEFLTAAG